MANKIKEAFAMVKKDTTVLHTMVNQLANSLREVMERQKKLEQELDKSNCCKCMDAKSKSSKSAKSNSKRRK